MMRQTNIVWVGFLGAILMVESLGFQVLKAPVHTCSDVKVIRPNKLYFLSIFSKFSIDKFLIILLPNY